MGIIAAQARILQDSEPIKDNRDFTIKKSFGKVRGTSNLHKGTEATYGLSWMKYRSILLKDWHAEV